MREKMGKEKGREGERGSGREGCGWSGRRKTGCAQKGGNPLGTHYSVSSAWILSIPSAALG